MEEDQLKRFKRLELDAAKIVPTNYEEWGIWEGRLVSLREWKRLEAAALRSAKAAGGTA